MATSQPTITTVTALEITNKTLIFEDTPEPADSPQKDLCPHPQQDGFAFRDRTNSKEHKDMAHCHLKAPE